MQGVQEGLTVGLEFLDQEGCLGVGMEWGIFGVGC